MIGDTWCQDYLNNAGCGFDGGDCCGTDVKTHYCSECECLGENITVPWFVYVVGTMCMYTIIDFTRGGVF